MRKIGLSWVGLLAALSVSGCVVEITFDPIGTDASMAGQWTINGAAPTQASCDALGVSHVRVRFYDGTRGVDHPGLVFPCAQGSFDTRPDAVVADGVWTVALVAIDAAGTPIGTAPQQTFDTIAVGGHIALTPVNFEAASTVTTLAGAWTINGAAPTAANCAELGATEIHVQFLDGSGTPGDDTLKLPCADGNFSQEMDPGAYDVRLVAVSATDTIAMAEPQAVTLTQGMTTTLTTVNFGLEGFDPTGTDAILTGSWTIGGSTAAIADQCAAVGGADIELVFYDPADTDFEDPFIFELGDCSAGTFTSTTPALAAGTYVIDAYLWAPTGDEPISFLELGELEVTAGTFNTGALDFRLEQSTIVANIGWEGGVGSEGNGVFGACAAFTPNVGTMSWILWQGPVGTGTMVATSGATDPACAELISIDATTAGGEIAAGTYALQVQGAPSSDPTRKNWVSSCDVTVGDSGALSVIDCDVSYME